MRDMRITAILAPLPIQDSRANATIVNNVFNALVAAFSAFTNLLY